MENMAFLSTSNICSHEAQISWKHIYSVGSLGIFFDNCPEFFLKQLFWKFSEIYQKNTFGRVLLLVEVYELSQKLQFFS